MQITTDITYLFLNTILLLTFIISGQFVSRKVNYWSCAVWCIVAFTLIQGLRYGRGNDYIHYTEVFRGLDQQTNALFLWLNSALALIGIDKHTCFIFYAFVFSTCGMIFLQNFKKCAKWVFPLFIVGFLFFNEYQIRQAFSYSFFFLYMHFLFKIKFRSSLRKNHFRKRRLQNIKERIATKQLARSSNSKPKKSSMSFNKKMAIRFLRETSLDIKNIYLLNTKNIIAAIIVAILCIEFHSANGIIVALFTLLYVFVRRPLTYWIAIPVYLLFVYVIPNVFDFSLLEFSFVFFSDSDTLGDYVEHADFWFSETGMDDMYSRNPMIQLFEVFGVSSLLYLGYKHITDKFKPHYPGEIAFYHSFFIGTCILSAFRKLELLNRMGYDLSLLLYILMGIVLFRRKRKTAVDLLLIWFAYDYLKYFLFPGEKIHFLWDLPLIHPF